MGLYILVLCFVVGLFVTGHWIAALIVLGILGAVMS